MKNTVVVNLFAGPGAGKSTCAWEIASKLKKLGYVAEHVGEYAKELVWDENYKMLDGTLEHQKMLLQEQQHRQNRLIGKVDFIITDSPTILNLQYLKEDAPDYIKNCIEEYKEHNNFSLFIKRGKEYEQAGRIHSEKEAKEIDLNIKNMLRENDIFFGTYIHQTIDLCIENIIKTYERTNNKQEILKDLPGFEKSNYGEYEYCLSDAGAFACFYENMNLYASTGTKEHEGFSINCEEDFKRAYSIGADIYPENVDSASSFLKSTKGANLMFYYDNKEALSREKFIIYKDLNTIINVYYNPDAFCGGQLVENFITFDTLKQFKNLPADELFSTVSAECSAKLIDIDNNDFINHAKEFIYAKADITTPPAKIEEVKSFLFTEIEDVAKKDVKNPVKEFCENYADKGVSFADELEL